MKLSIRVLVCFSFLFLGQLLLSQWVPTHKGHPQPVSPHDIALMAWGPSSSDADTLREMREAGLNISGFCHVNDLAAVEAADLSCFVDDARINGYDWTNLPPDDVLKQRIAEVTGQLAGHPGAIGFFLTDEPSIAAMPALGKVSRLLHDAMPDRLSYVNLFPYQVSRERLGTDYNSYVRALVKTVGQSFLSYDNYALVNGELNDQFYTNLEIVRRLGIELKTPFWNCIQSNAHYSYAEPTDANLHLQAYASLAYGSRGIQYFTYFTPGHGNFRLAPLDVLGYRTPTWDMLRRVNGEIAMLAPTLGKLHSTGVYHYPSTPAEGQPLSSSSLVERIETTEHRLVVAPAAGRVMVGEFMDASNKPYLMIVNKDLQRSFYLHIDLRDKQRKLVLISQYTGKEEEFSGERQWIQPGGGFLFRVD
jgi:hypothetical protein